MVRRKAGAAALATRRFQRAHSPSSIRQFDECALAWKYQRVDKIPRSFIPSYFQVGSAFHTAAERYGKHCLTNGLPRDAAKFENDFRPKALAAVPADSVEDLSGILDRWVQDVTFAGCTSDSTLIETQFGFDESWLPVPFGALPRVMVRGRLDFAQFLTDDHVVVSDYKTSRSIMSAEEVRQDLQMLIYGLWAVKAHPAVKTVDLVHDYVRFGVPQRVEVSREEVLSFQPVLESKMERVEAEVDFEPTIGAACDSCSYQGRCPIYEKATEGQIITVETPEDAQRLAEEWRQHQLRDKLYRKALRPWVQQHGPVDFGDGQALGFKLSVRASFKTEDVVAKLTGDLNVAPEDIWASGALSTSETAIGKLAKHLKRPEIVEEVAPMAVRRPQTAFGIHKVEKVDKPKEAPDGKG